MIAMLLDILDLLPMRRQTAPQKNKRLSAFDFLIRQLREEFLGFVEAQSATGEALVELFTDELESKGIDLENMRAQAYDGVANMAGIHKGVQSRIKERIPGASYVHCKAHNLNLSIVHASGEPLARTMMDTVQAIVLHLTIRQRDCFHLRKTGNKMNM